MLSIAKVNFDAVHPGTPNLRPGVDLTVLSNYENLQVDGEPNLIVELIDLYLHDAQQRVAVMWESLAESNWASLKREAHTLRGSSGNLGALQTALICDEIEGLESRDPFAMEALLACLERELEQVINIFLAERQRRSQ